MILSRGLSKTVWRARVSSTAPRPEPRCPPVLDMVSRIVSRISVARASFSVWLNFFKSSGPLTRSRMRATPAPPASLPAPPAGCLITPTTGALVIPAAAADGEAEQPQPLYNIQCPSRRQNNSLGRPEGRRLAQSLAPHREPRNQGHQQHAG